MLLSTWTLSQFYFKKSTLTNNERMFRTKWIAVFFRTSAECSSNFSRIEDIVGSVIECRSSNSKSITLPHYRGFSISNCSYLLGTNLAKLGVAVSDKPCMSHTDSVEDSQLSYLYVLNTIKTGISFLFGMKISVCDKCVVVGIDIRPLFFFLGEVDYLWLSGWRRYHRFSYNSLIQRSL